MDDVHTEVQRREGAGGGRRSCCCQRRRRQACSARVPSSKQRRRPAGAPASGSRPCWPWAAPSARPGGGYHCGVACSSGRQWAFQRGAVGRSSSGTIPSAAPLPPAPGPPLLGAATAARGHMLSIAAVVAVSAPAAVLLQAVLRSGPRSVSSGAARAAVHPRCAAPGRRCPSPGPSVAPLTRPAPWLLLPGAGPPPGCLDGSLARSRRLADQRGTSC